MRLYITALLSIAPIIFAIERAWLRLERHLTVSQNTANQADLLIFPKLSRQARLRRDLVVLAHLDPDEVEDRMRAPDRLCTALMVEHIDSLSMQQSHVLSIYTWILYRPILDNAAWGWGQLMLARDKFWRINPHTLPTETSSVEAGLEAWFFEHEGTVRTELQRRFVRFEGRLTADQRAACLRQSPWFLQSCLSLAKGLGEDAKSKERQTFLLGSSMMQPVKLILHRTRMFFSIWINRLIDWARRVFR